jgi:NAD(P)-dependent dehydrogenase (short-subunit alcohol dehydrogenase family)
MTDRRIAVVTGASKGAGKGIAAGIARSGAKVYVTARDAAGLERTVERINAAGGEGVAVPTDHRDDAQVEALFDRVAADEGRLDILVNNATIISSEITAKAPFWEKRLDLVDILDVGLRSHYTASYFAAPLLINSGAGLVTITSSPGSMCYMHGPAYGAGKAGADKLAHDMAHDFEPFDVAVVSIWMGILVTDQVRSAAEANPGSMDEMLKIAESDEFTGRLVNALADDPDRMKRSGQVFYGSELSLEYGVTDLDGSQPKSHRDWLGAPPVYSTAVIDGPM